RDPGEIATLGLDLLVLLCLLGLELGELVPGGLPVLAGADLVFGHLISLLSRLSAPRYRSRNETRADYETHRSGCTSNVLRDAPLGPDPSGGGPHHRAAGAGRCGSARR